MSSQEGTAKADRRGKKNGSVSSKKLPPALDPERMGLIQPYKTFVDHGWVSLSIDFSANGTGIKTTLKLPNSETEEVAGPLVAKEKIIAAGLWKPRDRKVKGETKGPSNPSPSGSLCAKDLELEDDKLRARISAVAKAIGSDTARGRIGSLHLGAEGVSSFDDWWAQANAAEKVRLLADGKHHKAIGKTGWVRISSLIAKPPFRGTVPQPKEEEEGEENEEANISAGEGPSSPK